jgi:hypothetical protein
MIKTILSLFNSLIKSAPKGPRYISLFGVERVERNKSRFGLALDMFSANQGSIPPAIPREPPIRYIAQFKKN